MNPAFASSRRKLDDLGRELNRLQRGNRLLDVVRFAQDYDEADKSWVVNAAMSAGVSGLYTGMEDILRGLLSLVDRFVPSGENSHQAILDQAAAPNEGTRPAIISDHVYEALADLKGFRHFERHNYRFRFDTPQVEQNETTAEEIVPLFTRDILEFIKQMSQTPDEDASPRLK